MSLNLSRRAFGASVVFSAFLLAIVPPVKGADDKDSASKDSSARKNQKAASPDPVYESGGDVKAPKLMHYVEPAPSNISKERFVDGTVRLSTVVTVEGKPTEVHVVRGLTGSEDQTAMDAVTQWRFRPGTKNGQPVNVRVTVEVEFHLL